MREIRLTECETVVLSLADEAARRASASALCDDLGLDYRFVDAIRCAPGPIGCGLTHIKALRAWNGERPLLVLEDDVALAPDAATLIAAPEAADAVYLGVSRYGAVEPVDFVGFVDLLAAERIEPGLLRIHNMLGAHAILYLSDRWRRAAIEAMLYALADRGWDPDRGLARIQGEFNVYALEAPTFYQSAGLQPAGRGWMQEAASRALSSLPDEGSVVPIWLAGERRDVRLERTAGRLRWVWA
jgi:hypothetical protein